LRVTHTRTHAHTHTLHTHTAHTAWSHSCRIDRIEACLSGASVKAGSGSTERRSCFAYEPGCGRARNLAYLATKECSSIEWRVLGVDLW